MVVLADELPRLHHHVLNQYVERFRSTLYRQTMFVEFEQRAHEPSAAGEPLTADRLDELSCELEADCYEPAAERDRNFLASGSRGHPLELLRQACVDMTSADPIEAALSVYGDALDEFEQLALGRRP